MANKRSTFDFIKAVRIEWTMNPITRVQDNAIKNKKRRRQEEKKLVNNQLEE